MRALYNFADPHRHADTLVVMLPGALQQPEYFIEGGFVDAVRAHGLRADLALVDLGLQYIGDAMNDLVVQRLEFEMVAPARRDGYRAIWLAGISIGAFIAMACAERYAARLDGLCLLSPYPGTRPLTNEIKRAGGIEHWRNDIMVPPDIERRVWQWLKAYRSTRRADTEPLPIYMGYGNADRFANGQQMLAQSLPAQSVACIDGGHDLHTWQRLWSDFLQRMA